MFKRLLYMQVKKYLYVSEACRLIYFIKKTCGSRIIFLQKFFKIEFQTSFYFSILSAGKNLFISSLELRSLLHHFLIITTSNFKLN